MIVDLYGYSRCSSCKNAEAALAGSGLPLAKRDLFSQPLDTAEIESLFRRIDRSANEMVATRSRPYVELGLADRSPGDRELVELMADHPALIRRPIVVAGTRSLVGFNQARLAALIAAARDEEAEHA